MKLHNLTGLILLKIQANLRNEISRYYLNFIWWVIEPILTMMVFYVVFSILLQSGTPNFTGFLLVGITTWQWFARTVQHGSQSILQGKGLMLQVNIHKSFFPLVAIGRDAFKQLFVITLLLVFLLFYPTPVTVSWVALPLLVIIQLILIAAFAMICAAIVPFLPDLFFIIQTGIHLMFFASGIFFDIEKVVLPEHRSLVYLNPMAGLIKNYRNVLIYGQWPDWPYLAYLSLFSILFFIISFHIISRFDHIYPRICHR